MPPARHAVQPRITLTTLTTLDKGSRLRNPAAERRNNVSHGRKPVGFGAFRTQPRAKRKLDRAQPQEEGGDTARRGFVPPLRGTAKWTFKTTGLRPWLELFRR